MRLTANHLFFFRADLKTVCKYYEVCTTTIIDFLNRSSMY